MMQFTRFVSLGVLLLAVAACGTQATPAPVFDGVVLPTRGAPPPRPGDPNPPQATSDISGTGAIFPAAEGRELTLDTTADGTLTENIYAILYTMAGEAGQVIDIEMRARDGGLDTYLILIGPDGREIARNDDSNADRSDAEIRNLALPESGSYTIVATRWRGRYTNEGGDFQLELEAGDSADPATPPTTSMQYDSTQEGTIDDQNPAVYYTFAGEANDIVDIRMGSESGSLDPTLILTDSFGTELARNDDANPLNNIGAAITDFHLPYTGYYTIIATRFDGRRGESTGEYDLIVEQAGRETTDLTYAYLDGNQSLSLLAEVDELITYGYLVGDTLSNDGSEVGTQAILTFFLPPVEADIQQATLDLSRCDTGGLGWDALDGVNAYADMIPGRINGATAYDPTSQARLLATLEDCGDIDLTGVIRAAYDNGSARVQVRLMPQTTAPNNAQDVVAFLAPRLRLTTE